jgi:hypothetical protein
MRMATIQAKRLQEALQKAKKVGRVEDQITICGCNLVLQALGPDEYEAIIAEASDRDEVAYLHAFQLGHVSRAIVEIDGMDLRGVDSVEVEVPTNGHVVSAVVKSAESANKVAEILKKEGYQASVSPPDGSEVRTIKIERHQWLKDEYLRTWGREAITVAWRKFAELLMTADAKAKEGVQFKIPDETPEDKLRRLLADVKEAEDDLPDDLVKRLLEDAGFLRKSTPEELAALEERAREFAREQAQKQAQNASTEPQEGPEALPPSPTPASQLQASEAPVDPQTLMRNRRPMNDQEVGAPVPYQGAVPRRTPTPVSPQIRQQAVENSEPSVASTRAAKIAELESQVDPTLQSTIEEARRQTQASRDIPELSKPSDAMDGRSIKKITDQPPVVGINPRFRPPPR